MGQCQCSTAGFCNKFQREMSAEDFAICGKQSKMGLDVRSKWQLDKLAAQGRIVLDCIWKGEKKLDEHGFVMRRFSPACCGRAGGNVDRYICEHPLIEEGETDCELRCHYRAILIPPEGYDDSVSLPISSLTDVGESASAIGE